ncbi:MAG TPA: GatB/YqeY domain-containing protein [Burkholderiales bacterium]|jgi:hypothetical protein
MSLKDQITEDMKSAMRAKEAQKLSAIRMLLAAIKQVEVDKRIVPTDADVTAIVEKEIKKRRDSITQYTAAKREDLAANEQFEVDVLSAYLPKQADDAEIEAVIAEAVAAAGGSGPQVMGKVMGAVKAKLAGRADMTRVSALVKAKLAG